MQVPFHTTIQLYLIRYKEAPLPNWLGMSGILIGPTALSHNTMDETGIDIIM
jgi:hypothetical protein